MIEARRQAQLKHIRAAIAECDRVHTPEEIAAAERQLSQCSARAKDVHQTQLNFDEERHA